MGWIEHDHADFDALVEHVAGELQHACAIAIRERGAAWLALAGGRTPLPIYARLAQSAEARGISVIPTDERCVPREHAASNFQALRRAFASDKNVVINSLTRDDGDIETSLAQSRVLLALNPQPFDAVLLGMGADGHFASLFPGATNLSAGLAMEGGVDAIATLPDPLPPEAPYARISLTLPRLLRARHVHLVVTGEDKRRVLRRAQQQETGDGLPVAALLHARDHRVQVHWSPSP